VQDLRKQAELALDARIRLFLDGPPGSIEPLGLHLAAVAADTLADDVLLAAAPDGAATVAVTLAAGVVTVALEGRR
jgi:hypothetical protein